MAGNYSDKLVAVSVTNGTFNIYTSATLHDASTNLGKLTLGVTVDAGSTFYFWDLTSVGTGDTNHNFLDSLLNKDINGVKNTTVSNVDGQYGTTDTYRYATFYDTTGAALRVALPTIGGAPVPADGNSLPQATPTTVGSTTASNGSNAVNSTYNDLPAVWDAYNGVGTTPGVNGAPPGWGADYYWSATATTIGHAAFNPANGGVQNAQETFTKLTMLQVL